MDNHRRRVLLGYPTEKTHPYPASKYKYGGGGEGEKEERVWEGVCSESRGF
jgi:hypothetical protein